MSPCCSLRTVSSACLVHCLGLLVIDSHYFGSGAHCAGSRRGYADHGAAPRLLRQVQGAQCSIVSAPLAVWWLPSAQVRQIISGSQHLGQACLPDGRQARSMRPSLRGCCAGGVQQGRRDTGPGPGHLQQCRLQPGAGAASVPVMCVAGTVPCLIVQEGRHSMPTGAGGCSACMQAFATQLHVTICRKDLKFVQQTLTARARADSVSTQNFAAGRTGVIF